MAACRLDVPPPRCSLGADRCQHMTIEGMGSASAPSVRKSCAPPLRRPSGVKDVPTPIPSTATDAVGRCRMRTRSRRANGVCDSSFCVCPSKAMVSSRKRLSSASCLGESAYASAAPLPSHRHSSSGSRTSFPSLLSIVIMSSLPSSSSCATSTTCAPPCRLRPQHRQRHWFCTLRATSDGSNAAGPIAAMLDGQALDDDDGEGKTQEREEQGNNDQRRMTAEEEEDKRDVESILLVVEKLKAKRDMTMNEIRLTIMIEDPRVAAEREEMWVESDVPREEVADALLDVCEGRPVERSVLRALAREMREWPDLEDDEAAGGGGDGTTSGQQRGGVSPYAAITDTGIDPAVAQRVARREFDEAANVGATEETKELGDILPPWVGYGFLYTLSSVPIIIVVVVVAVLFVNSLQ
ncbi:hypothetical protein CBR_g21832 [Chara braunii]|uniref:Uncharacterized protein n=1 Tax=Chara braunii TaxID=69332 RepID=A0A388JUJ4_CHABU|nr:hypothetical protein CBR_g21832 [Chara braunii]|eukprot:GBG61489.1 hypothetical protein CBR_g21832 [Chara braunii]